MSDEQLNVIFVDDDERVLEGLRRQLRSHRQKWNMRFAMSSAEALESLQSQSADVIVSDMRMPGMTGGQFFQHVLRLYPQTVRIILSGQADHTDVLRDLGCIHQYLQKPCDPPQLCSAIERTCSIARRLRQPNLRLAASRITALPPSSQNHRALVSELSKEAADASKVAGIVAQDPALTAKLLQLVNSAFFGFPRRINNPKDAVVLLGIKTLHSIVIAARIFDEVSGAIGNSSQVASLWNTSFQIGECACRLAEKDGGNGAVQGEARLAGLLSLIGRAILLTSDPDHHSLARNLAASTGLGLSECETECFGSSQEDVTAYALGLWAFSDDIVAATAFQTAPSLMPNQKKYHPAGYLHLARCLLDASCNGTSDRLQLDESFAKSHGLMGLLLEEMRTAA